MMSLLFKLSVNNPIFLSMLATLWAISSVSAQWAGGEYNVSVLAQATGMNSSGDEKLPDGWVLMRIPDEVRNLTLPVWLKSWDDLEFFTKAGTFNLPLGHDSEDPKIRKAAWVYSMAGGKWYDSEATLIKRDISSFYEDALSFLQTGSNPREEDSALHKRLWIEFVSRGWKRSSKNIAQRPALDALSQMLEGNCSWIHIDRSAICSRDDAGNNACVSWTGGLQAMLSCAARDAVASVRYDFGYHQALSGWCRNCGRFYYGRGKRNLEKRYASFEYERFCVSNRPNGC